MKNAKKVLLLVLCAVLLVGASVAGTVAYLTSEDTVTNTFTVGKVIISLDEYVINDDGTADETQTTKEQEEILLVPGRTIEKHAFITVDPDSEDCWLFVKIENGLEAAGDLLITADWTAVGGHDGYYMYNDKATAESDTIDVFTAFECSKEISATDIAAYEDKQIIVTAYAVQAEGIDKADAWTALDLHYELN